MAPARPDLVATGGCPALTSDRFTFCVGYTADGNQHLEEALVLSGITQRVQGVGTGLSPQSAKEVANALADRFWRAARLREFKPHGRARRD